jgi:A/G-specific adenine glycosylase
MAKQVLSDDDYESSASEEYRPAKRRRMVSGGPRTSVKGSKPRNRKVGQTQPELTTGEAGNAHPVSQHVLSEHRPLQKALLEWYATVHDARGMPWRKPFDPSWTAEQKAQRAYEVSSHPNSTHMLLGAAIEVVFLGLDL